MLPFRYLIRWLLPIISFLRNWLSQAKSLCSPQDAKEFGLDTLAEEIRMLEKQLSWDCQNVGFCHNDLQYGNIMMDEESRAITIIVSFLLHFVNCFFGLCILELWLGFCIYSLCIIASSSESCYCIFFPVNSRHYFFLIWDFSFCPIKWGTATNNWTEAKFENYLILFLYLEEIFSSTF